MPTKSQTKKLASSLTKTSDKRPKFRSKFEEHVAKDLEKKCGSFTYEGERISYTVERKYLPDFTLPNGIYIETKGYFKSADQRKHRILKEQYPDIELRFVFQRLASRVQGSQMTCAEWCEKYGFLYAEGTVPKEWIDERN
jgi:hypothetical protein